MASIIRVKRSTGTTAPSSLNFGELAVTLSGSGTVSNKGDRLYVGDNAGNPQIVGGRYYTSMMDHTPGAIAAVTNSINHDGGIVVVLDSTEFWYKIKKENKSGWISKYDLSREKLSLTNFNSSDYQIYNEKIHD